ncbi:MAG: hypothetical protein WC516_05055 [Patescibacteria group bacterium]|jgi:hypothetical protein
MLAASVNGVIDMHEINADEIIEQAKEVEDQYIDLPFNFEEE